MKKILIVGGCVLAAGYALASNKAAPTDPQLGVTINALPGIQSADIRVFNASSTHVSSVFAHCTLRDSTGARIDSVPVFVADLAPGDVAKETARTVNPGKVARVDCMMERVNR